jgi:predicted phosphodiesterase
MKNLLNKLKRGKRKSKPTNYIDCDLKKEEKAIIVPFSDIHLGSPEFNRELFEENLNWIYNTKNAYVIGNGDWVECATKGSVGAGVYEQVISLNEQIEQILDYFSPLAEEGRILGITNGNHEDRTHKESGIDISRMFAEQLSVPYFKNGGHFRFRVGRQNYTAYFTHGSSGARLPWTKIKQPLDLGRFISADIIAIGHVHDLQVHSQEKQKVDFRGNIVKKEEQFYILTGHYLNWENSYAQGKSLLPSKQGTPKIKLHSKDRNIRISI